MVSILEDSDTETKEAIWNHLLTISASVDPAGNAKQILKASLEKKGSAQEGGEEAFLANLIDKVEKTVDPQTMTNPMQAIGSMLSSGVFNDMIGSMQKGLNDGSLDLGRLMGTMQGLMSGMGGASGSGAAPALPFDLSAVTGLLGNMMPPPPRK